MNRSVDEPPQSDKSSTSESHHVAQLTGGEHKLCIFVFILMGAAALYFWNSVISTMFAIIYQRLPEKSGISDTIFATYCTTAFATTVFLYIVVPTRPLFNFGGGLLLTAMTIIYPAAALYTKPQQASIALHFVAGIAGISEMFFQVSGFGFAVILKPEYGGWVSFGYGICGVLTFCMWTLSSKAIFKISDRSQPKALEKAVWLHFAIAAVILLTSLGTFYYLFSRQFMKDAIARSIHVAGELANQSVAKPDLEEADGADSTPPPESTVRACLRVARETWLIQLSFAFLIGTTMMAFPSIGPYQWGNKPVPTDILTGMHQVGEFVGRSIPSLAALGSWLSFTLIPRVPLYILTYLRVVLLILFILVARSAARGTGDLLQNYGVQMVLIVVTSFTNGWYASVYMARVSDGLKTGKDRARASAMAVCLLLLSIASGLWLAKTVNFSH